MASDREVNRDAGQWRCAHDPDSSRIGEGLAEVGLVWALFALAAVAIFVTYARLPPADLYHTSVDGLAGGAGRTLVFLNYPAGLAAIALIFICADRLAGRRPRLAPALAAAGVALCLVVVLPGVVDQGDLDARIMNVLPAFGVAVALGLTVVVRPRGWARSAPGDRLRAGLGIALVVLAVPWMFAEAGFYAPDPIYADELPKATTGEDTLAAVHLGFHHGTAGVELALTALLLSRTLSGFRHRRLALVTSCYLALMLAYGVANAVQDGWGEQVVKRGWTDAAIPSVIRPQPSLWWALILVEAAAVWLLWFRAGSRAVVPPASVAAAALVLVAGASASPRSGAPVQLSRGEIALALWVHDIGDDHVLQASYRRGRSGAWPEPILVAIPRPHFREREVAFVVGLDRHGRGAQRQGVVFRLC
jgi:hypothetical protein